MIDKQTALVILALIYVLAGGILIFKVLMPIAEWWEARQVELRRKAGR